MMRRGIRTAPFVPPPITLAILALVVLVLPAGARAAGEGKERATELLDRAAEVSRLRTAGTTPFRVMGTLKVSETPAGGGGMLDGTYLLVWSSPAAWREEYRHSGFDEIRVGGEGTVHVSRTPAWRSLQIQRLAEALDQQSLLRIRRKESVDSIESRNENGRNEDCVGLFDKEEGPRVICMDAATGALLSVRERTLTTVYEGYRSWDGKSYPTGVRILRGSAPLVEFRLGTIEAAGDADPALFAPPEGSEERRWCEEANAPIPRIMPQPDYPADLREKGVTGRVVVYGTLGRDVKVRNVEVLESSHPYLTWAVTQAIKRWWIRPATCGTRPIKTDLVAEFDFPPYSGER